MKKYASIYKRGNCYYIVSSHKSKIGILIEGEPMTRIYCDAGSKILGDHIINALAMSCTIDPASVSKCTGFALAKKFKELKSWKQFVVSTLSVSVEVKDNQVRFEPYKNLGSKGGFVPLIEKTLVYEGELDAVAMGEAVMKAIELAE